MLGGGIGDQGTDCRAVELFDAISYIHDEFGVSQGTIWDGENIISYLSNAATCKVYDSTCIFNDDLHFF